MRKKITLWCAVILIILVVIGITAYIVQQYNKNLPGIEFTNQGREHITLDEAHPEYNSNPPTSGWHSSDWEKDWGIQVDYVEEQYQIHNLEHGGIIVHYQPDKITNLSELESLFTELQSKNKKMLLMPNPKLDTTYALTAWTRLDAFDQYDAERIKTFTQAFYNKGPEKTIE
ncbi:MAG: DUF3105 domain-containing protein [Candidatus Kerfeldbacteria bacterium]|nr:DUF3105 domain-containing protein [Candidatus Kerfeldbacteria bacterium]